MIPARISIVCPPPGSAGISARIHCLSPTAVRGHPCPHLDCLSCSTPPTPEQFNVYCGANLRSGRHQPERAFGSLEDHRDLPSIELVMRHHPEGVSVRASHLHSLRRETGHEVL